MAEIVQDENPRRNLYRLLLADKTPGVGDRVKKYSFTEFENRLLTDEDTQNKMGWYLESKGIVADPVDFSERYLKTTSTPPTPKPQAAPKQQFMEAPSLEEEEPYVPEPQPLVGSPEYDKQLQKQYGGMAPTLGATFGGVPAAFETKEQKKQEQLSPAFKAQQLAFEDVPIAEEQRRAQKQFAKATKQQQQAALRGGTGFELQQERANEARESTQKLKDFGSYIGATFDNMIDKAKGAERIFAAKQKALLTFGDRRKKAEEEEKRVKQQIVNYVDKLDADFAAKQTDYNIEGNLFDAIRKGQWDRIPEAFAYNLAQIGVQALAATSTGGYSMFAQVFPDMYKAGVEEIAKKTKTTPEQVIASGNDKELLSYIGGGINGYIEYLSGGILGKAMRSEGAYKFLRDKALEKIGKTKWKQAAASAAALGGVSGIEGLTEVGQGLTEVITPQIAAADTFKGARENIYRELQKPETQRRLASEFVGGAAGGGGIAAGGRALSRTLEGDFTYGDVRKAPQRADYDVVQTDNKIQERNKIAQAMEEAVKANPEAEGQIRQQYQKRINEAAPTDEEVLSAYDGLAVLPETEEKNTIRENLEAYMAEKGIQPEPTGMEAGLGEGLRVTSPVIQTVNADFPPPQPPTSEEEVAIEEAPTEEELSLEDQLMGLVPQEETAPAPAEEVAPAEEEVATEEIAEEPTPLKDGDFVIVNGEKGVVTISPGGQISVETDTKIYDLDERGLAGIGGKLVTPKEQTQTEYEVEVIDDDNAVVNGEPYKIIRDEKGNTIALQGETRTIRTEPVMVDVDIKRNKAQVTETLQEQAEEVESLSPDMTLDKQKFVDDIIGQNMTEGVDRILSEGVTEKAAEKDLLQFKLFVEATIADLRARQKGNPYADAMIEQLQEALNTVYYEYYSQGRKAETRAAKTQKKTDRGTKGKERVSPKPAEGKQPTTPVTPPAAAPKKEAAPKPEPKKEAPKPEPKKETPKEEKSVSGTPQEGDKVEIAPQREGGSPRNMVFKDGEWKQNVGGDIVKVGPAVQQQAQEAFGGKAEVKPAETKGTIATKVEEYEGVFNPNKTGVAGIDELLEDDGYQFFYKGKKVERVLMSPNEYLERVRKGLKTKTDANILEGKTEAIKKAIESGAKINAPFISTIGGKFSQEGRNRAVVAKELGEQKIPVFIESDVTFDDKINRGAELVKQSQDKGNKTKEEVLEDIKKSGLHRDGVRFIEENYDAIQEQIGGKPIAEKEEGKKAEAKEEKVTPAPKKGVFADLTEIGGIKFGKDGVAKAVPIKGRIEKVEKAMGVDGIFKIYTLSTQYGVPIEVYGDIDNFVEGKPVEGSEVSFTANVRNLDYRLRVIGPKTEYKQPKPATTTKEEKPAPAVQPTPPRGKGATILPSVDADKADAQLYILQSNNYYTLWYKRKQVDEKTGKTLWSYSNYLTILSQDLDDARTKALDYLNKIASGEFLSTAFVGKNTQGLTDAKTIALQEGVLTPETQPISKSKTPGVEKTFGIGKYSNLTIDELLDKDPDYAQWFVNNYTSRGAEQTKAIIKGDPRYQDYINIKRDIEELEKARIEAYEAREAERKAGGKVKVATLVRGEEGEIKEVIEETEVPKKKVEKKERRLVKDQITDIVPPQAKAEDKVDANLKPQMFAAQINGANTAIASLDKYGVVLNGDGAGVGKTRQIIAVAKYYADKGKPVVIISENAALGKPFEGGKKPALGGSMAKDSEAMGVSLTLLTDDEKVQPGGIYVSTYNRIQDADVPEGAIVIFDESHNLVNTFGRTPGGEEIEEERQWEAKFRPMLKKAGAVAYYTATPADKPHQLAYLYKVLGFNSPEDFLSEMMLNGAVIKERKFGRTKIKYYDVPKSKAGRTNLYKWVNGLMVKAGEQGRFIKREISYEGTDVQFQDIKGTDENKNEYAKEFNKVLDDMSDAEMMDYRLLAPGSYILYAAELAKIGEAVNIVKKQLAQGRKSIIFVSRINPMEIRGRREQFDGELGGPEVVGEIPSPVPMLEEALRKEGISFVGLHSKAKTTSQKAQKQFAEEADVLIASLESGGTGINLDDTVGDNPRTEVFLFSPYRGISTIQGMGRIWRASTIQNDNNPNRYIFVTASDIAPDLKRSGVLAKKLQLMNAAIGGTAVSKLPMSKVSYSSEELIGIELPDDADEESAIFREKTGILKPVSIKWNISRKGGYFANATADLLEWMERGGPERTGLDVRVFKTEEGKWIALAGKDYKAEEFAPENIANEAAPSFTSQQSSEAATAFDKAKTSKGFDKKYGKGAYKALSDITKNFDAIMDKVSDKIKQDCL